MREQLNITDALRVAQLWYPIMLTQTLGDISEAKACELLGLRIQDYRDKKADIRDAVLSLLDSLPSPLTLLLEDMKAKQS